MSVCGWQVIDLIDRLAAVRWNVASTRIDYALWLHRSWLVSESVVR